MRGHRVVTVRPQATDFMGRKVREVRATLRFGDPADTLEYTSDFTSVPDDVAFFEYDFVDPQRRCLPRRLQDDLHRTVSVQCRAGRRRLDLDDVSVTVI